MMEWKMTAPEKGGKLQDWNMIALENDTLAQLRNWLTLGRQSRSGVRLQTSPISGPVEEPADPRETVQDWSKTTDFSGSVEGPTDSRATVQEWSEPNFSGTVEEPATQVGTITLEEEVICEAKLNGKLKTKNKQASVMPSFHHCIILSFY